MLYPLFDHVIVHLSESCIKHKKKFNLGKILPTDINANSQIPSKDVDIIHESLFPDSTEYIEELAMWKSKGLN